VKPTRSANRGLALSLAFPLALALLAACGGDDNPGDDDAPVDAAGCTLPAEGDCDGNTFRHCVDGLVTTQNCTDLAATCALGAGGYACIDQCVDQGVTETGSCRGGSIEHCATVDGIHTVVTEACNAGSTCSEVAGAPTCVSDLCAGIGELGRCDGDTVERCDGGAPDETDCTLTGQVCGYGGDATGYTCVAPGTTFTVYGTVRYEDRPPQTSGALGAITTAVARSAQVSVVADQGNTVLATALTADDGSYTLRYTTTAGTMVHIMAVAQSTVPTRPIRVWRANNQVHGFGGTSFAAAASTVQDILVTDASGTSEAFNVLDQAVSAMDVIRNGMGDATPTMLTARWVRGSTNGTYYSGNSIFLLGASDDDDGYDDTVILHEIGHFVEDTEGRSDSPGGGHDGSPTNPTLAWSEGFSTYFNMAVRGVPHYMDSNSGGGWGYNADTSVTRASMAGNLSQNVSEDMISEILWDIGDGGPGDDDQASSSTHLDVLRVQVDYLVSASLRAVGVSGVDLVDFLDGWFDEQGLSSCAGVRNVVITMHTFPYDFAGPGGACP
jgi:hypothetical protein